MSVKLVSAQELAKHNTKKDCWLAINGSVYNVTSFLDQHPGGAKLLLKNAGKDVTEEFEPIHPASAIDALPPGSKVGALDPDTVGQAATSVSTKPQNQTDVSREEKPHLNACLNLNDFEIAAEKLLKRRAFAYFKSGADDEWTADWNQRAFQLIRFRPRVLIDIEQVDTSTTILGQKISLPFLIAPAAMAKQAHPDGEIALTRAAGRFGIGQAVCTNSSYSYEELARHKTPEQAMFYQVYVAKNRDATVNALRRAKELGYKGILLTVDGPVIGKRERDERENITLDDAEGGAATSIASGVAGLARASSTYFDIKLTWSDIDWIRSIVGKDMPLAVKGIQTAEDAAMCARYGVAVYLSNHGGRQLNGSPSSIETLLEIRRHCQWVFDTVEVFVDGGYRRGTDILKALALGARAVFIGRPFLYSLAFGQEGAERAIEILASELITAMQLCGITRLDQIGPQYVNAAELESRISRQYEGPGKPWFGSIRSKL